MAMSAPIGSWLFPGRVKFSSTLADKGLNTFGNGHREDRIE
ncbi:hypothetical protein AWB78_00374 [Caballeronia calidae]|uniref:Uncharacterized protein n=1 Tax=Caballeronia calidae TaxID=1777139 RepID=A0A157ZBE4_9BURK|nr:hypothetical protein AWB78_00374 [Caballeronia calidae]